MALGRTISEIDSMPYDEFSQWMAYYSIEPFGARRDNIHAAVIASTMANCFSKKQYKIDDFMLKDETERRRNNMATFVTGLRSLAGKNDKAT